MLSRVRDQRPSHNNSAWITSSVAVSRAKLLYYRAFAYLYGIAGGFFASRVMVNSNWTRGHVAALWKRSPPPTVVFPPCDTTELEVKPPALQYTLLSNTDSHHFLIGIASAINNFGSCNTPAQMVRNAMSGFDPVDRLSFLALNCLNISVLSRYAPP